jgi:hypothetical protein
MNLEETNLRNLVNSFRDELVEILDGGDINKILTRCARKTLRRHGVLQRRKIALTEEALEVLNS